MPRYLVVIEKANGNYSAYSPDILGCVATGATEEETEKKTKRSRFRRKCANEQP